MIKYTEQDFIKAVGRAPIEDDLERINCEKAGQPGHHACGWCDKHNSPRFLCACLLWLKNEKPNPSCGIREVPKSDNGNYY